jgi:hypothetical protein
MKWFVLKQNKQLKKLDQSWWEKHVFPCFSYNQLKKCTHIHTSTKSNRFLVFIYLQIGLKTKTIKKIYIKKSFSSSLIF